MCFYSIAYINVIAVLWAFFLAFFLCVCVFVLSKDVKGTLNAEDDSFGIRFTF